MLAELGRKRGVYAEHSLSVSEPQNTFFPRWFPRHSCRVFFHTADEFDFSLETLWPDGNLISGRLFSGELEQAARLKPRSVCCVTELCSRANRPGHLCRQRALTKCVNGQCTRAKGLSGKRDCV